MIIKPGKYVQRDGGIATVGAVDESREPRHCVIGWTACGHSEAWFLNGRCLTSATHSKDLISEYREPREWWIACGLVFGDEQAAMQSLINRSLCVEPGCIIHVREVLP